MSGWSRSLLVAAIIGCAAPPPPVLPPPPPPPVPTTPVAPPADPALHVLLRPSRDPSPHVHVELDLDAKPADLTVWHIQIGAPGSVVAPSARDATGPIDVDPSSDQGAFDLTLARAPSGHVHLAYDVAASGSTDDPRGVFVKGDRFHGAGERLVALPAPIEDQSYPVTVDIDLASLEVEKGASSFGVGKSRTAKIHPRALRYALFLAGSHDDVLMDTIDGHDEAAWLGVAPFDLRETVVELAQERTIMAGVLGGRSLLPDIPWTYLFEVASQRPAGEYAITPRIDSVFVQLGTAQSMTVSLRMALARPLAQRWIGDAIRLHASGHPPDLAWFDDGFAEYLSLRALARVGVLAPEDWAGVIRGELALLATSGDVGMSNDEVAARVKDDPAARDVLMARGALFAARESALISARTNGAHGVETVLAALLVRARGTHFGRYDPLSPPALLEELAKDDPDAAKSFDAMVIHGQSISLPPRALGDCFRAGTGEYVAFDAGFDLARTRRDPAHRVVDLRPDGPAARAGLKADDDVTDIVVNEEDTSAPARITVMRGGKKVVISYAPRGKRGKGQTWTRLPHGPQCGLPP